MFEPIRDRFFPVELISNITARCEPDSDTFWSIVAPLMEAVFPSFQSIGAFEMPDERWETVKPLRSAFAASHHEWLIFEENGQPIGWSFGDQRDAVTFFMTSTGILSDYRGRGIYTAFLRRFLSYLSALGYERVVSNHQTNNRAVIIAKLKVGFNVTAVNLDERWGAQVEVTYHFYEDRRRGYERAFALAAWPGLVSHES